jgi:hypothetical protein
MAGLMITPTTRETQLGVPASGIAGYIIKPAGGLTG